MRKITIVFALACIVYAMTSCATTETNGTVTKSVDPLAYQSLELVLQEWQRTHPVNPDK